MSENAPKVAGWIPFVALYRREFARFMKVVFQTVFTPLINATLYLLIFGVSLGQNIVLHNGFPYLAFLIPGLVMMSVLNNAFQNSSSTIVAGKFSGDLEDLRISPLSRTQILWALNLAALTRGLLVGLVTFLVGYVFYFVKVGTALPMAHPFVLLGFLFLGGLIFASLGITVAFLAKSFDQLSAIGAFVLLPLIYLGGVFFSLESLHPVWQLISKANPVLYLINGVRYGILGDSDVSIQVALVVSVVTFVLFYLMALRSLRVGSYQRW